jgi:D,D-heptose 1,7-bisphosphate phosphatase
LIVITNQSGVARGYFPESALLAVEERLCQLLAAEGIYLADFYYCPHHPDGVVPEFSLACDCRKPAPGLLLRAAGEHNIDLRSSWFVGDILNDVEAGHCAGCKTILLDNGNETEWELSAQRTPDFIVTDLMEAAQVILCADGHLVGKGWEMPIRVNLN